MRGDRLESLCPGRRHAGRAHRLRIRHGLAAVALLVSPFVPSAREPAAQEAELARQQAKLEELADPEAGSSEALRGAGNAIYQTLRQNPDMEIDPRPSLDAMIVALEARGESLTTAADFVWNLSLLLRDEGRVELARTSLEYALSALGDLPEEDTVRSFIHIELCELLRHAGVWSDAQQHMDAARVDLFGEAADPFEVQPPRGGADFRRPIAMGTWFDVAGQFYMQLGRTEIAARYFEEHEKRALDTGEQSLWWGALDNKLRLAYLVRDYDEIERLWYEAQEHPFWQRAQAVDRGHIDFTVARSFIEGERLGLRDAGEAFEMLIELAQNDEVHPFEAFAAEVLLASILLDEDVPEEAEAFLEAARERRSAWGGAENSGGRAFFALKGTEWRAARASGEPSRVEAAFAESREIFDDFRASWGSAPAAPDGTGFLQTPWRTAFLAEIVELHLVHAEGEAGARAALDDLLRVQELGSFAQEIAHEIPTLQATELLRASSDPRHAYLCIVPGPARSLAFVVGPGDVRVFSLASAGRLEQTQRRLRERAFDANRGLTNDEAALSRALEAASRALLPEELANELLQWDRITLVGADGIGIFAFDALPIDGRPLGVQRAVDHIASFPIARWLAERVGDEPPLPRSIHVVFPTSTEDAPARFAHLQTIPFDEQHVTRMRASYGEARVSYGADARIAALEAAGATAAWTIVGHGVFDPERPRPSGLLLEGGDILWGADIEQLTAPPVVSLIACGAGRGLLRVGDDGRSHLGNAFLRSGARAILLGSLDLSYRGGLALDQRFHARVAAGDSPAEALRAAREQVLAEGQAGPLGIQALAMRLYGAGQSPLTFVESPGSAEAAPSESPDSEPAGESTTTTVRTEREGETRSLPLGGLVLGGVALLLLAWGGMRVLVPARRDRD